MSENLSKMSEKYKDETGLDSEKHIAPFSLTEWKNSSARWQMQSPDSPEWHPDVALLYDITSIGENPLFFLENYWKNVGEQD